MKIYCTGCNQEVEARLTTGEEIYPHRPDLYELPFWKCDGCKNYVGCHHKTKERTKPLGVIPTPEIMQGRKLIHSILDPLWKSDKIRRGQAYAYISKRLGYTFHNGEIRSLEELEKILYIVQELHKSINSPKIT